MSTGTPLNIGLFGYGCVGQGLHDVLQHSRSPSARIARIVVRDPGRARPATDIPLGTDADAVFNDPAITTIVEAIDDAGAAWRIAQRTLQSGRSLVTANKKMVATHLPALIDLQRATGQPVLYEAAVCGGMPLLGTLGRHFADEHVHDIEGIVNGTTNVMLSRMMTATGKGDAYAEALRDSQESGYAEADPTSDVEGWDAVYKTVILAWQAFGVVITPHDVIRQGISGIGDADIRAARAFGREIKLVARLERTAQGLQASVLPTMLERSSPFAGVHGALNAVRFRTGFSGEQFLSGAGAGAGPTASAVAADLRRLLAAPRIGSTLRRSESATLAAQDRTVVYVSGPEALLDGLPLFATLDRGELNGRAYRIGPTDLRLLARLPVFTSGELFVCRWAQAPGASAPHEQHERTVERKVQQPA